MRRRTVAAIAAVTVLVVGAGVALAQGVIVLSPPNIQWGGSYGSNAVSIIAYDSVSGQPCIVGSTATCLMPTPGTVSTAPAGFTSTSAGATLGSAGTFASVLSASGTRHGCLIQNTSADYEWVFTGTNASAATSKALKLAPLGLFYCGNNGIVVQDNISVAGAVASGDAYTVISQ